ncbi:MAG TPA: DinB family protein [Pyrinomonadaceae bacterium]|nr:DinB family protein [Pyrinomonadaceae bacterium]
MNTVEHLHQLYGYNAWANRRIVAALVEHESLRCRALLAHLLTTEQEYFERLWGRDSTGFEFWPRLSIQEIGTLASTIATRYDTLLAGATPESLDTIATYRTSDGVACENTWLELLSHVLIHSSTHRGNIMLQLREYGYEPPVIDYIIYLREKGE